MRGSPQNAILLCCAAGKPADDAVFLDSIQRVESWDQLIGAAEYHGLVPLLAAGVLSGRTDHVPPEVWQRLRAAQIDASMREMYHSTKLGAVLGILQRAGVSVVPLKGPRLGELLYVEPGTRPSSDLDLLVHERDVDKVLQVLQVEGYQLREYLAHLPASKLVNWATEVSLYPSAGIPLDLHWRLAPRDYPFQLSVDLLWQSSAEGLMLYLCVHGTKHQWMRLIWLSDIARLVQMGLNWERLQALAAETRCERPLRLGLLLAHDLLGSDLPEEVLEECRAEPIVVELAQDLVERLSDAVPGDPQGWETTIFTVRLAERWWDKVRHFAALLRAPTEAELRMIQLPPALFPLYYPIRAVRLAGRSMLRRFGSLSTL